jgi:hypothetical protein
MPRLLFVRHLPASKLRHRYRSCRHPVERPRWHALWLLARADAPRTPAEVADLVGLTIPLLAEQTTPIGPSISAGFHMPPTSPLITSRKARLVRSMPLIGRTIGTIGNDGMLTTVRSPACRGGSLRIGTVTILGPQRPRAGSWDRGDPCSKGTG